MLSYVKTVSFGDLICWVNVRNVFVGGALYTSSTSLFSSMGAVSLMCCRSIVFEDVECLLWWSPGAVIRNSNRDSNLVVMICLLVFLRS